MATFVRVTEEEARGLGGPRFERVEVEDRPSVDGARSRARAVMQGATLGFGDEIIGGLIAGLTTMPGEGYAERFGSTYRDVRDAERAGHQQFREERPALATALEVGGVADHLHVLARQSRTKTVAAWVEELKTTSS